MISKYLNQLGERTLPQSCPSSPDLILGVTRINLATTTRVKLRVSESLAYHAEFEVEPLIPILCSEASSQGSPDHGRN